MMKEKTLFALGVWIFCLPYLGFPIFWKNLLFVVTGLFVCMLAYLMYRHKKVLLKLIDESGDKNDTPAHNTHHNSIASTIPEQETEKVVFKSEYNPVEDAQTPKVSPYSNSHTNFKTFYEEKSGPLIHRVTPVSSVDTVTQKTRVVRKRKTDTSKITTGTFSE